MPKNKLVSVSDVRHSNLHVLDLLFGHNKLFKSSPWCPETCAVFSLFPLCAHEHNTSSWNQNCSVKIKPSSHITFDVNTVAVRPLVQHQPPALCISFSHSFSSCAIYTACEYLGVALRIESMARASAHVASQQAPHWHVTFPVTDKEIIRCVCLSGIWIIDHWANIHVQLKRKQFEMATSTAAVSHHRAHTHTLYPVFT